MEIDAGTMPEVRRQYTEMIEDACTRAVELQAPGLVVEFELLPPLTQVPEWGAEVTKILRDTLDRNAEHMGSRWRCALLRTMFASSSALRICGAGQYADAIFRSFELCAGGRGGFSCH